MRLLAGYLAPAALAAVACFQLWSVSWHGLTAWKGGGFGMFSSLDAPDHRSLRVSLIGPHGARPVQVTGVGINPEQMGGLLAFPDEGALRRLAGQLLGQAWVHDADVTALRLEVLRLRFQARSGVLRREAVASLEVPVR